MRFLPDFTGWPILAWLTPLALLSSELSGVHAAAPNNSTCKSEAISSSLDLDVSYELDAVLDPVYTRLPTGAVKPYGWALNMAQVQANGLASQQPVWFS